jgi:hypothetical protein
MIKFGTHLQSHPSRIYGCAGRKHRDAGEAGDAPRLSLNLFEALFGTSCSNGVLLIAGGIQEQLKFADLSDMAPQGGGGGGGGQQQSTLRDVPLPPMDEPIKHVVSMVCESAQSIRSEAAQSMVKEGNTLALVAESGSVLIAYMREQSLYWVTRKLPCKGPVKCACSVGSGMVCVMADACFWIGLFYDEKGTPSWTTPQHLDMPR